MIDKPHDIEFASPEEIKLFQEVKMHEALLYLNRHSRYYQRMFERYRIRIEKIRTIEDLVNIPFTEKKDLQLFNEDFLCHHQWHAQRPCDLLLHREGPPTVGLQ